MEGRPKRSNAVEKDYRERKRVRRRSSTDNVRHKHSYFIVLELFNQYCFYSL